MAKEPIDPILNPSGPRTNTGNRKKTNTGFESFADDQIVRNGETVDVIRGKYTADPAASLYNAGMRLEITHVASNRTLWFPAFVENFSDAYNSEWNAVQVYGRMDPISTYQHTRRAISVAWKIPSASVEEGVENMNKINEILSYLYPTYVGAAGGVATINMSPLWRIKFGNLISSANNNPQGLLGYVNGLTMDPIMEDGMFAFTPGNGYRTAQGFESRGPMRTTGTEYIPKTVRLNFEFTVLHEHPLGWTQTNKGGMVFRGGGEKGFPYASRGLGVRMPPAMTLKQIQYGTNPQIANKPKKEEKRSKRKPKGESDPGKQGQAAAMGSKEEVKRAEEQVKKDMNKSNAQLRAENNKKGGLLNLKSPAQQAKEKEDARLAKRFGKRGG